MTEGEWIICTDPVRMVEYLRFRGQDRRLRLVGCAACRRVWDRMADDPCRRAVEAAEQYADDAITYAELDRVSAAAEEAFEDALSDGPASRATAAAAYAASYASSPDFGPDLLLQVLDAAADAAEAGAVAERAAQAGLFREVFGNPRRPGTFAPSWRTSTVVLLARQMYDGREFSPMPILADALQDAGCDDPEILQHCRGPGLHARGCWVVDLILAKE